MYIMNKIPDKLSFINLNPNRFFKQHSLVNVHTIPCYTRPHQIQYETNHDLISGLHPNLRNHIK